MFQYVVLGFPEKHFSGPIEESHALLCSNNCVWHNQADLCFYTHLVGEEGGIRKP